jgi:hypothetical protein
MTKDQVFLTKELTKKYNSIKPFLNEQMRRIWAAAEARSIGKGGAALLAEITGLATSTIYLGLDEIKKGLVKAEEQKQRVRKIGGGRKKITEVYPNIVQELESLVESTTRGDPESPLKWTCKSTRNLCKELQNRGFKVSQPIVGELLHQMNYSLQSNLKTKEGCNDKDRDEQFQHISKSVLSFQEKGLPVISVDAKKKELIGNFKNHGKEWQKKGQPLEVKAHDFQDPLLGKAVPYGVYDISANKGWVNVGFDHDTAQFAIESIRRWWNEMGKPLYPNARELLITADGGGSNGHRIKLWKAELQKLANELSMDISVRHFPPGTSKWNKIEHRLFCHITANWRSVPLTSREVIVNLIGSTKTEKGLTVKVGIDENTYAKGIEVGDEELKAISIERSEFRGEWNYKIMAQNEPAFIQNEAVKSK